MAMGLPRRAAMLAAGLTAVLTTASVTAVAAGHPAARQGGATCAVPSSLAGARVTVMLGDMGAGSGADDPAAE
jgi:hypothetical protein